MTQSDADSDLVELEDHTALRRLSTEIQGYQDEMSRDLEQVRNLLSRDYAYEHVITLSHPDHSPSTTEVFKNSTSQNYDSPAPDGAWQVGAAWPGSYGGATGWTVRAAERRRQPDAQSAEDARAEAEVISTQRFGVTGEDLDALIETVDILDSSISRLREAHTVFRRTRDDINSQTAAAGDNGWVGPAATNYANFVLAQVNEYEAQIANIATVNSANVDFAESIIDVCEAMVDEYATEHENFRNSMSQMLAVTQVATWKFWADVLLADIVAAEEARTQAMRERLTDIRADFEQENIQAAANITRREDWLAPGEGLSESWV